MLKILNLLILKNGKSCRFVNLNRPAKFFFQNIFFIFSLTHTHKFIHSVSQSVIHSQQNDDEHCMGSFSVMNQFFWSIRVVCQFRNDLISFFSNSQLFTLLLFFLSLSLSHTHIYTSKQIYTFEGMRKAVEVTPTHDKPDIHAHTHTHTHTHAHTHTYIHTHAHTDPHT